MERRSVSSRVQPKKCCETITDFPSCPPFSHGMTRTRSFIESYFPERRRKGDCHHPTFSRGRRSLRLPRAPFVGREVDGRLYSSSRYVDRAVALPRSTACLAIEQRPPWSTAFSSVHHAERTAASVHATYSELSIRRPTAA